MCEGTELDVTFEESTREYLLESVGETDSAPVLEEKLIIPSEGEENENRVTTYHYFYEIFVFPEVSLIRFLKKLYFPCSSSVSNLLIQLRTGFFQSIDLELYYAFIVKFI